MEGASRYFKSETLLAPLPLGWVYFEGELYMISPQGKSLTANDWHAELWVGGTRCLPMLTEGEVETWSPTFSSVSG